MALLIGRLLLLLLLACDWAADPSQGTSPLSRPMASTETFCHSLAYRQAVHMECAADPAVSPDFLHAFDTILPQQYIAPIRPSASLPSGNALVYVLLSIRR